MPELPEVETTVRGLARFLEGATLERVSVFRPDMRFPFPPDLVQALTGARVTALSRRAKYGLIHTDRARTLVFHLGMSGRWRIDPEELVRHDHLLLETSAHRFALHDPRRFGWVDLVDDGALGSWPGFAALGPEALALYPAFAAMGPEPLGTELSAESLGRALAGRKQAIKLLLLDQRIVAGLGNIYVCEALYRAGIRPTRAGGRVSRAAMDRLVPAIRQVLTESIEAGGSTLRDYARPDGELGYFAASFDVYGREGEPCGACGAPIRRIAQGGRSTWFCGTCQK